jgi:hypothetical protein
MFNVDSKQILLFVLPLFLKDLLSKCKLNVPLWSPLFTFRSCVSYWITPVNQHLNNSHSAVKLFESCLQYVPKCKAICTWICLLTTGISEAEGTATNNYRIAFFCSRDLPVQSPFHCLLPQQIPMLKIIIFLNSSKINYTTISLNFQRAIYINCLVIWNISKL